MPNDNKSRKVSDFLYQKGLALNGLGRHEEAIEVFNQVLEINPKDARTMNEKGVILLNLSRNVEALETFNQTLKNNPYYSKAKENKKIAESKISE